LRSAFIEARTVGADLVVAHDQNGERLTVGAPWDDDWRWLTGDETGALLADYLLSASAGDDRLVVTTEVSSTLLWKLATEHGVRYAETAPGFGSIMRPAVANPDLRLVLGYEEASGFATNPAVPTRDGLSAAVAFLRMVSEGPSAAERLGKIMARHGWHLTDRIRIPAEAPERLAARIPPDLLSHRLRPGHVAARACTTERALDVYFEAVAASREAAERDLASLRWRVEAALA
jgi:phosphomannomutase